MTGVVGRLASSMERQVEKGMGVKTLEEHTGLEGGVTALEEVTHLFNAHGLVFASSRPFQSFLIS